MMINLNARASPAAALLTPRSSQLGTHSDLLTPRSSQFGTLRPVHTPKSWLTLEQEPRRLKILSP